jgi:hypothetical protein
VSKLGGRSKTAMCNSLAALLGLGAGLLSRPYPRMPTLFGILGTLGILELVVGGSWFSSARFCPVVPIEKLGITGITGGGLA